jgi:AcrR family transcriptional regulator
MRRRLSATQRRDKIIKACLAEAKHTGSFSQVSARAVARRAGCTHPILYHHFKNRSELIRETVNHLQDRGLRAMSAWAGNERQTVVERIRGLMDLYLSQRSNREIVLSFGVLSGEEWRNDPQVRAAFNDVAERYASIIMGLITKGIERGELRKSTHPEYVSWRLVELGMFVDHARLLGPPNTRLKNYISAAIESLVREITPPVADKHR